MSDTFDLPVERFTQRDNKYIDPITKKNVAGVSCFPTSIAMCETYIIEKVEGKDKAAVGCAPDMQLEDYINAMADDPISQKWLKENVSKLGQWITGVPHRTLYDLEAFNANRLMNPLGYKASFQILKYEQICDKLEETKLPMVIGGNFSSICAVQGHMLCCRGFNKIGSPEFILNDPYGNALKKYVDDNGGDGARYPIKYFFKDSAQNMYVIVFEIA